MALNMNCSTRRRFTTLVTIELVVKYLFADVNPSANKSNLDPRVTSYYTPEPVNPFLHKTHVQQLSSAQHNVHDR